MFPKKKASISPISGLFRRAIVAFFLTVNLSFAIPPAFCEEPNAAPKNRLAIIIDDVGYNRSRVESLIEIGIPLTFSILPGERLSKPIAERIHKAGHEIMLHMPMEPLPSSDGNPGSEALLISQADSEITELVKRQMKNIPYAVGANNHMGSLFTADEAKLSVAISEINKEGFFFIDSLTSPKSVACKVAAKLGVKCLKRDIFLDYESGRAEIRSALKKAMEIVLKKGSAIAIGHPKKDTIAVIKEMKPEFEEMGVTPVFVSELVK